MTSSPLLEQPPWELKKLFDDPLVPSKGGRVKLTDVNPHLVCVLCHGYFVDATSIVECLHSFCRSCIVLHLDKNNFCPICREDIQNSKVLKPDKALQDIVYKLVPGLFHSEMKRRQKFYHDHPHRDMHLHPESRGISVDRIVYTAEQLISLSLEFYDKACEQEMWKNVTDNKGLQYKVRTDKPSQKCVVKKRYLKCPAAFRMSNLKKFIRVKYNLKPSDMVELLYRRESLPEDYSVMDIAYMYTWNRNEPMRFFYKINACVTVPVTNAKTADAGLTSLLLTPADAEPVVSAPLPLPPMTSQPITAAAAPPPPSPLPSRAKPTAAPPLPSRAKPKVVAPAGRSLAEDAMSKMQQMQQQQKHKVLKQKQQMQMLEQHLQKQQQSADGEKSKAVASDGDGKRPPETETAAAGALRGEPTVVNKAESADDKNVGRRAAAVAAQPAAAAAAAAAAVSPQDGGCSRKENVSDNVGKKKDEPAAKPAASATTDDKKPAEVPVKKLEKLVDRQQQAAAAQQTPATASSPSVALKRPAAPPPHESKLNLSISKLIMKNQAAAAAASGKFVPTLQQMQQIGMHTSIPSFLQMHNLQHVPLAQQSAAASAASAAAAATTTAAAAATAAMQPNCIRPGMQFKGCTVLSRPAAPTAVPTQTPPPQTNCHRPPFIPVRKSYEWNRARNLAAKPPPPPTTTQTVVNSTTRPNERPPPPSTTTTTTAEKSKKTATTTTTTTTDKPPSSTAASNPKNLDELNAVQSLLKVGQDLRLHSKQPPSTTMTDLHDKYNCESSLQITKITEPESFKLHLAHEKQLHPSSQPTLQILRVPTADNNKPSSSSKLHPAAAALAEVAAGVNTAKPVNKKPVPSLYSMPAVQAAKRTKEDPQNGCGADGKRIERRVETENGVLSVSLLTETSKQDMDAKRREVVQPDVSIKLMSFAAELSSKKEAAVSAAVAAAVAVAAAANANPNGYKRKLDESVGGAKKRKQDEPNAVVQVGAKKSSSSDEQQQLPPPPQSLSSGNKRKQDEPAPSYYAGPASKRKQNEPARKATPPKSAAPTCTTATTVVTTTTTTTAATTTKDDVPQLIEINSSPYVKLLPAASKKQQLLPRPQQQLLPKPQQQLLPKPQQQQQPVAARPLPPPSPMHQSGGKQLALKQLQAAKQQPTGVKQLAACKQQPTGVVKQPTGVVKQPTGVVKQPAAKQQPTGVVKQPTGVVKQPSGVKQPAGVKQLAAKQQPTGVKQPTAKQTAAKVLDLSKSPPNNNPNAAAVVDGVCSPPNNNNNNNNNNKTTAAAATAAAKTTTSPVQQLQTANSAAFNSNLLFAAQRQAAAFLLKQHFDSLNNGKAPVEWPRAMFNPSLFTRPPANLNN